MINKIVLSGGPGTGKTSIINALESMGFHVFHEVSRSIIQQELSLGTDILPWDNLFRFSEKVMEGRMRDFEEITELSFYDRSIIDTIAYLRKDNDIVLDKWDLMAQKKRYYPIVFITPPWKEIYNTDGERKESYQDLQDLHHAICETYSHYNYTIIEIPKLNIEKRVDFILKQLDLS